MHKKGTILHQAPQITLTLYIKSLVLLYRVKMVEYFCIDFSALKKDLIFLLAQIK